jgi:plasmid stability protein
LSEVEVAMTNLTLAIDDHVLRRARIRAMEQGTSVNALVREYIVRLAGESDAAKGIAEFLRIVSGTGASSGSQGRTWSRDELHDRTRDR